MFRDIFLEAPLPVCNNTPPVDKDIRFYQSTEGRRYLIAFVISDREAYVVILDEVRYLPFDAEVYADKFDPVSKFLI